MQSLAVWRAPWTEILCIDKCIPSQCIIVFRLPTEVKITTKEYRFEPEKIRKIKI